MMRIHPAWGAAVVAAIVAAAPLGAGQQLESQIPYGAGQNVAPVFEGWERNADGTFNMVFGYMNRNYDERPEIPVGPNNSFSPGPADRGQPTHFYPRRQQFMFKVRVPATFSKQQQLVWTLTRNGKTEKAVGKLDLEWEISQVVYSQNRRGLGSDAAVMPPNNPPSIGTDGPAKLTATVGAPLALTVNASDDGIPKPPAPNPGRGAGARRGGPPPLVTIRQSSPVQQQIVQPSREGLAVTWAQWRGPGRLTFTPARMVVKDGKASTSVTFSEPGTYVIRAYADDGVVFEPADFTVTVTGSGRPSSP